MRRGELTIFFSLIFILILSFVFTLVESVRMQGVRMRLQVASDAACESQFASYDKNLFDVFNVFFFDGSSGYSTLNETTLVSKIISDMNEMCYPNKSVFGKFSDFYKINLNGGELTDIALATDDSGMVFRENAILSMKGMYGIAFAEQLLEDSEIIKKNIDDGDKFKADERDNSQVLESLEEQKEEIDKEKQEEANNAKEHENPLTAVEVQKNMGILEMTLPQQFELSQMQLQLDTLPSERKLNKGQGYDTYSEDLLSKVLFDEYLINHFNCATDSETLNNSENLNGQIKYQMEYLLGGNAHDTDNLKAVVEKLLLVREGVNFAYLLSDSIKVSEVEAMAAMLVGYTGLVPLIEATKYAILLSWALAESTLDVKRLLAGKNVSMVKNNENWQTELANIANVASQKLVDDEGGIEYKQYLRLFMLLENQKNLAKRCLDLVEMKIRNIDKMSKFRLDSMVGKIGVALKAESKSVFCSLFFMKKYLFNGITQFDIKRNYSYEFWL